jgi:succinyl-CoA synthetase alpha subunit
VFEDDPATEQVVLVGEIGGQEEEMAATFIADQMTKPVVAFVAGQAAPLGRRMGHPGAIIEGYDGTAKLKIDALRRAGARVARTLDEIPDLLQRG